ncbi:hypothetical protein TARUN_2220 [Trichoderma arundinaceum]|uniref:Uncharacterized protein n=1 Tax=Trichoderma arundinaceum TaxID=490622 RepID=A0A395NVB8_TRIAR|nr:hypothetical protein TARUN_2220 [Trichoderma arundinaceum]
MSIYAKVLIGASYLSLALAQRANINFYDEADLCRSGLVTSCTGLPPGVCCRANTLAICMDFASDDRSGIATAFSSQAGNPCAIVLESLLSGVCVCPTGFAVISGGSWRRSSRRRRDDGDCEETVDPDTFQWTEDGETWTVHNDDIAIFTEISEAVANSTNRNDIGKLIKEHGKKE